MKFFYCFCKVSHLALTSYQFASQLLILLNKIHLSLLYNKFLEFILYAHIKFTLLKHLGFYLTKQLARKQQSQKTNEYKTITRKKTIQLNTK